MRKLFLFLFLCALIGTTSASPPFATKRYQLDNASAEGHGIRIVLKEDSLNEGTVDVSIRIPSKDSEGRSFSRLTVVLYDEEGAIFSGELPKEIKGDWIFAGIRIAERATKRCALLAYYGVPYSEEYVEYGMRLEKFKETRSDK